MNEFWVGVISSIVASAITGTFVYFFRGNIYQKRVDDAPTKFVQRLDELIWRAVTEGQGDARVNARAIVSMRNSFRRHAALLTQLLNSDIDTLEMQLTERGSERIVIEQAFASTQQTSPEQLFETIRVLQRTWAAKRDEVELEIRKLLVTLGLDRV